MLNSYINKYYKQEMDYLNNIKKKIPPQFMPYIQLAVLCATSFYYNCLTSTKCIYNIISSYNTTTISATSFNEFVTKEVKKSNNKYVFEPGVWLCSFYLLYCAYLLVWYVVFGLLFIMLFPTLCWLVLWGIVLFTKEKILNKTASQVVRTATVEMNDIPASLFKEDNIINNTVGSLSNAKEVKLD